MPAVTTWRNAAVVVLGAAGSVFFAAPVAPSEPCYNGVFPLNPYADNCGIQPRPPRVLGSAPDATAILTLGNGGGRAQCLSLYVNGGYGWYPGAVLVPGYHP